jgi:hypothetical protein
LGSSAAAGSSARVAAPLDSGIVNSVPLQQRLRLSLRDIYVGGRLKQVTNAQAFRLHMQMKSNFQEPAKAVARNAGSKTHRLQ